MKAVQRVLDSHAKLSLLTGPTPLEPLDRLSDCLGGPQLWVKRDDCTGLAFGGNKVRKLEYLLGDALARDADLLITNGALQSNHARLTAAAAVKAGMACDLLLAPCDAGRFAIERKSGNALLDRLLGANLHVKASDQNLGQGMRDIAAQRRREGFSPYIINAGGSSAIGSLGYVACALEIAAQAHTLGVHFDYVLHAAGSCGTQAGLVTGFQLLGLDTAVLGVAVSPDGEQTFRHERVAELRRELLALFDLSPCQKALSVLLTGDYSGPCYGEADAATFDAISLFAQTESIILDPVYSGKAAAAAIGLSRKGRFSSDANVLFLHTGGTPALFARYAAAGSNAGKCKGLAMKTRKDNAARP